MNNLKRVTKKFDFKKAYKEFYLPSQNPHIIDVPKMNFIAVLGKGNPNDEKGEYKEAIGLLYGIAFTIKMSYKSDHKIQGFYDYVVPPLEGFWWQSGEKEIDYKHKERFEWISLIRLPDFITKLEFNWAITEATEKKKTDFSKVKFLTYTEGLCIQCMHIGPYDNEPETINKMKKFAEESEYEIDIDLSSGRYHHEIYLSDARRCQQEKLKTVIRIPIKKKLV